MNFPCYLPSRPRHRPSSRPQPAITLALCAAWTLLVLLLPASCWAGSREESWTAKISVEEAYTDNVRSAASGPRVEGAFFTTFNARLRVPLPQHFLLPSALAGRVRARRYGRFASRDFVQLEGTALYELDHTTFFLRYYHVPRRLRLEDAEGGFRVFFAENNALSGLQYKFGKGKKWRLRALFEAAWDDYNARHEERDSFTPTGSLDLRYRWHSLFVPRIRYKYGVRNATRDNFDRRASLFMVGFDSAWTKSLQFTFRYRNARRKYTVSDPSGPTGRNSNFRRFDDIDEYEGRLRFLVPHFDGLAIEARYRYRFSDSTRASRNYKGNEVGVGISYEFR